MEASQMVLLVAGLVLVLSAQSGLSIKCHMCNSAYQYEGEACDDPVKTTKYVVDCNEYGANYTQCRKIEQTVNGEYRIIRQCAKLGRNSCMERAGTKGIKLKYCTCTQDKCNSAPAYTSSIIVWVAAVVPLLKFLICKS